MRQLPAEGGHRRDAAAGQVAAAPFGIVERFAEPERRGAAAGDAAQCARPTLQGRGLTPAPARSATCSPTTDADIIAWFRRCSATTTSPCARSRPPARRARSPLPERADRQGRRDQVRVAHGVAAAGPPGVKTLELPKPPSSDPRPSRWWASRLQPGFHVVEIASPGWASAAGRAPRQGRDDVRAHRGAGHQPGRALQAGPRERAGLGDHAGQGQAGGRRRGARVRLPRQAWWPAAPPTRSGMARARAACSAQPAELQREWRRQPTPTSSARAQAPTPTGAWTTWPSPGATGSRASSPGASTCPPASSPQPDARAHTMFDRTLLRAGETVSMKHFAAHRDQRRPGLPRRRACPTRWSSPTRAAASSTRSRWPGARRHRRQSADSSWRFRPRPSWASTRWSCAARGRDQAPQLVAAASSASKSSACRCSKAASAPPTRSALVDVPARAGATCRSTTSPAAARPTCRCAVSALLRGKYLQLRRTTTSSASTPPRGDATHRQRGRRRRHRQRRTPRWWPTSCR